jgi:hypothetical protein
MEILISDGNNLFVNLDAYNFSFKINFVYKCFYDTATSDTLY